MLTDEQLLGMVGGRREYLSTLRGVETQGRADGIEEAMQTVYTTAGWVHNPTRDAIAAAILALSSPPPDTTPAAPVGPAVCEWVSHKDGYKPGVYALFKETACPSCGKPISLK